MKRILELSQLDTLRAEIKSRRKSAVYSLSREICDRLKVDDFTKVWKSSEATSLNRDDRFNAKLDRSLVINIRPDKIKLYYPYMSRARSFTRRSSDLSELCSLLTPEV